MGKIFLIRHGETDSNKDHRFQGRMDNPLNAAGIEQAERLVEFMKEQKLDVVYSSSMKRAKMTADKLAESHGLEAIPMDLLQEVSFGDWEGLRYQEINERWPEEMNLFLTKPGEWVPPNGESFVQVAERCQKAFDEIMAKEGHNKNIAIVSHGGIVRVQLCQMLGIPLNNMWKLAVHNVSVTTLVDWDGSMTLERMNDNSFLAYKEPKNAFE